MRLFDSYYGYKNIIRPDIIVNSLFHMRAINYILNGDSLLNIFINEIIKDKSNSIKRIIVIDEKKINENLNASKKSFSRNNDINDSNSNIPFSQRSKTKEIKYKLKLDDKKIILKNNNKTQIDLIDEKNGKKKKY